jgi:hypothetical protein
MAFLWRLRQDFRSLIQQNRFDVAFSFAMALGCNQILATSGIPWIGALDATLGTPKKPWREPRGT